MTTTATGDAGAGALSDPVPTKFFPGEKKILKQAREATGFSNAELIRRAVRLLGREQATVKRYDFLLDLTPIPSP